MADGCGWCYDKGMDRAQSEIFQSALQLAEDERVALAGLLLSQTDAPADSGWEQAWGREIERRARELDLGAIQAVPWEEVRARLIRKLDAGAPR